MFFCLNREHSFLALAPLILIRRLDLILHNYILQRRRDEAIFSHSR